MLLARGVTESRRRDELMIIFRIGVERVLINFPVLVVGFRAD